MSKINASSEAVRQLASDIKNTIKELTDIKELVERSGNVSGWDDAQGEQFQRVVKDIASLTVSPVETLRAAIPRLQRLAETIEKYNQVKF